MVLKDRVSLLFLKTEWTCINQIESSQPRPPTTISLCSNVPMLNTSPMRSFTKHFSIGQIEEIENYRIVLLLGRYRIFLSGSRAWGFLLYSSTHNRIILWDRRKEMKAACMFSTVGHFKCSLLSAYAMSFINPLEWSTSNFSFSSRRMTAQVAQAMSY